MTETDDFLAELRRRAHAAQAEEIRFRRSITDEIAARERARAFAFRRVGLMETMARAGAGAGAGAASPEAARAAMAASLRRELGWHGDSEVRARVLAEWAKVAAALAPDPEAVPASPDAALAAFEAWYAAEFGKPFLALLDQETLDVPVVEF